MVAASSSASHWAGGRPLPHLALAVSEDWRTRRACEEYDVIHMRYTETCHLLLQPEVGHVQSKKVQESPILVMAPGFYFEKPVLPVLQRHFSAVWFHLKPLEVTGQSAVVPDARHRGT
jgi:hypothetical protein